MSMKLKYLLIPVTVLFIALSGTATAKNPHSDGPDARWENSNKQSDEHSLSGQDRAEERHRLKESKKHKEKKEKKYKHKKDKYRNKYDKKYDKHDRRYKDKHYDRDDRDDRYERKHDRSEQRRDKDEYYERDDDKYEGKHDRYERQRYKERYQSNPIDTVIDRNVDDAKSIIDDAHRKTIESIDNTSRELTGDETRRDRTKSARPWWSIFGEE